MLVAVLPALLVIEEYLDSHPSALADQLVQHYGLDASTGRLLRDVLSTTRTHQLGSALLAIVGALLFGLAFGRVLQFVHARVWGISLDSRTSDQGLYALVLLALYGLIVLLLFQVNELKGSAAWLGWLLALGWLGVLTLFFTWTPWLLLHEQVSWRSLLPCALLTALGLVILMVVSSYVMQLWVNLYAADYGELGVVLAIYFWLAFGSFVIVAAASIAPAFAQRRSLRAHEVQA
jgi:membrane protein